MQQDLKLADAAQLVAAALCMVPDPQGWSKATVRLLCRPKADTTPLLAPNGPRGGARPRVPPGSKDTDGLAKEDAAAKATATDLKN